MLRTHIISFAGVVSGNIQDVPAEQIRQVVVLGLSIEDSKQRVLDAIDPEDQPTIQFTDQCREIAEGELYEVAFEGWQTQLA